MEPDLSSFLVQSHFMARKIYQLSTLTSHDEVVTKEENEEKVVGKEIGTLVYNRINKSGSTSLLSW